MMDTTLRIASNNHHCAPQSLTLKSARTHCSCACWAAVCCELKLMWKMWTRKNDKCGRIFVSCFWHWKAHIAVSTHLANRSFCVWMEKMVRSNTESWEARAHSEENLFFFVVFTFGLLAFKAGAGFWHWRKKIGQVSRTGKKNGNRILEFWKRQRYSKFHAWNFIGGTKKTVKYAQIMPNWHVHSSKWHILSQRT